MKLRGLVPCIRFEAMLLLTIVVSGLAALWMTIHRHEGYDVLCARADDLYQLADSVRASNLTIDSVGNLRIDLEGLDESAWGILEGDEAVGRIEGGDPIVALTPGISHTVLRGEVTDFILDVRSQWIPGQLDPLVSLGSLRIGEASAYSIEDFVIPIEAHPIEQIEAARELLAPIALDQISSVAERVAVLAAFLHHKLDPFRGAPAPHMARLNGFEQWTEAIAGRSEVYCANHAEIFAFMANVAGLPTRLVDVSGRLGDVVIGAHSFVESYVREEGRWMYVDLQLSLGGVFDRGEKGDVFLDARELLARIRSGTTTGLVTQRLIEGRLVEEPWAARRERLETFMTPKSALVFLSGTADRFAFSQRLKRLILTPRPAICSGALAERTHFRLVASWLTIGTLGTWLAMRARHLSSLCSCGTN